MYSDNLGGQVSLVQFYAWKVLTVNIENKLACWNSGWLGVKDVFFLIANTI